MIQRFENGELIPKKEWEEHIEQLKTEKSRKGILQALNDAIKKRIPKEKFGILLSGGLDSTLIAMLCKEHTDNFICYSVGLHGASDLTSAQETAKKLQLKLKTKTYTEKEAEALIKETAKLFDKPDTLMVGVGAVILGATKLAKRNNITTFFSGLGSEEIFAGYKRHQQAKDINKECWKGLKEMWRRDITRDHQLSNKLGIKILVPFLDTEVIKAAMSIPGNEKIKKGYKKYALRKIAEEKGMPHENTWRKKKAAQYGSKMDQFLTKLSKKSAQSKEEYISHLRNIYN